MCVTETQYSMVLLRRARVTSHKGLPAISDRTEPHQTGGRTTCAWSYALQGETCLREATSPLSHSQLGVVSPSCTLSHTLEHLNMSTNATTDSSPDQPVVRSHPALTRGFSRAASIQPARNAHTPWADKTQISPETGKRNETHHKC